MDSIENLNGNGSVAHLYNKIAQTRQSIDRELFYLREDTKKGIEEVTHSTTQIVEQVKETLSLRNQIKNHPWPFMGGALAVGILFGRLNGSRQREKHFPGEVYPTTNVPTQEVSLPRSSYFSQVVESLAPALGAAGGQLQHVALSALVQWARGKVDFVPPLVKPALHAAIDEVEKKISVS